MKNNLLALFAFITAFSFSSMNAQAQEYQTKHEIAISYGWLSNSNWIDAFEDIGAAIVGSSLENEKFIGPISVEYFYHVNKVVGLGGIAAYGVCKEDIVNSGTKDGDSTNTYYTLMPAAKFDWLRKGNWGLYSKLAIGVTYRHESLDYTNASDKDYSEGQVHVNWQVSLIGVEAGSSTVRGFLELGTGEQGTLILGLRHKF